MKRYLLVFDDGNGSDIDLQRFVDSLDPPTQMYALDGRVCFIKTHLAISEVSDRFEKFAGSSFFFIADVSSSDCEGRMPGAFWDFIKARARAAPAHA